MKWLTQVTGHGVGARAETVAVALSDVVTANT